MIYTHDDARAYRLFRLQVSLFRIQVFTREEWDIFEIKIYRN